MWKRSRNEEHAPKSLPPRPIVDDDLGDGREIGPCAFFNPHFPPTSGTVLLVLDYRHSQIDPRQRAMFARIVETYEGLLPAILTATFNEMVKRNVAVSNVQEVAQALVLYEIDVRSAPDGYVLHFRNPLDDFDWYARLSASGDVVACGPKD